MTETEYESVPLDKIQTGHQAKISGIGWVGSYISIIDYCGENFLDVVSIDRIYVRVKDGDVTLTFRRNSITEARRKVDKPEPKPGTWRCKTHPWNNGSGCATYICRVQEVLRSDGTWSRDQREGKPWEGRMNDPVKVSVEAPLGQVGLALFRAAREAGWGVASLRSIGLTVELIDRRKGAR